MIPAHQVLTNLLLKKALIEFKANPPGIIPIQLTFEIQGISGLRITDVFNLGPGLLPSRYKDNISFTITGIDNQISNNRWTTTVSAVMMSTVPMDKIAENEVTLNEAAFDKVKDAIFDALRDPNFKNAKTVRDVISSGIYGDLFKEKGFELTSANLDITKATARFAINLMARINALIKQDNSSVVKTLRFRWTAGNDSTHFNLPYETPHQYGNGLDLAIQQDFSIKQRDKAIEIVSKAAASFPQVYFRDEYTDPSSHASGPHFHFGIDEAKFNVSKQKVIETKELSLSQVSTNAKDGGFM